MVHGTLYVLVIVRTTGQSSPNVSKSLLFYLYRQNLYRVPFTINQFVIDVRLLLSLSLLSYLKCRIHSKINPGFLVTEYFLLSFLFPFYFTLYFLVSISYILRINLTIHWTE